MDGRFLSAFTLLPKQRTICGYKSLPICLRHRLVLTQIDSPFVEAKKVPTSTDVLIAAKILSSYKLAEMMPSVPSKSDIEWVDKMNKNDVDLRIQTENVFEAIIEQSLWPIFWNKKHLNRDNGIPWVLSVVCTLVKNGIPLEDAWTMPESQAIWLQSSFLVASGVDVNIVSEKDLKAQEQLKRLENEVKKNPPVNPFKKKLKQNV
jgi:hypothetical protein